MRSQLWTRRALLQSAGMAAAAAATRCLAAEPGGSQVYFGTLARPGGLGIYASRWDAARGDLAPIRLAAEAQDCAFLLSCPTKGEQPAMLFGATENRLQSGDIYAFRVSRDGSLVAAGKQPSCGRTPVHLAVDRTGQLLVASNFTSGSLGCYRRDTDGSIEEVSQQFQYTGHGLDPQRQSGPHTHGSIASPDNRFLLVNDLGLDKIMVYRLEATTLKLTPHEPVALDVEPGSGPRHSIFHGNGRWVFCINELACTVTTLEWNALRGTLALASTAKILPEGHASYSEQAQYSRSTATAPDTSKPAANSTSVAARTNTAAELCLSADDRFVYATNRGEYDCVTVFKVDGRSGALKPIQTIPSRGKTARHITIDPSQRWAFVCCQDSGELVVFARDQEQGTLAEHRRWALPGAGTTVFA